MELSRLLRQSSSGVELDLRAAALRLHLQDRQTQCALETWTIWFTLLARRMVLIQCTVNTFTTFHTHCPRNQWSRQTKDFCPTKPARRAHRWTQDGFDHLRSCWLKMIQLADVLVASFCMHSTAQSTVQYVLRFLPSLLLLTSSKLDGLEAVNKMNAGSK